MKLLYIKVMVKTSELLKCSGHTFPLYVVLLVCLAAPSVPADPTTSPTYNKRTGPTDMNNKTNLHVASLGCPYIVKKCQ